jgi:hypothetical protein
MRKAQVSDLSAEILEEVRHVRKLLELIAEPEIAKRDARLREALTRLVGASDTLQRAVLLMNGSRTQTQISQETGAHKGNLSTLVGKLESAGLLADGKKLPKLAITVPANFFA